MSHGVQQQVLDGTMSCGSLSGTMMRGIGGTKAWLLQQKCHDYAVPWRSAYNKILKYFDACFAGVLAGCVNPMVSWEQEYKEGREREEGG